MKKIVLTIGVVFSTIFLSAGGNTGSKSNLSAMATISGKTCKVNKVYDEFDVHLMWQDQPYTDAENTAFTRNHSVSKAGNFNHAVNYCRRLNYAGYNDWRLPTAEELMHVHKKSGQLFTYYRGDDFWSSSASSDNKYYVVYPADAYKYKRLKSQSNYIRCVRCTAR